MSDPRQPFGGKPTPEYPFKGSFAQRTNRDRGPAFAPRIHGVDLLAGDEIEQELLENGIVQISDIIKYLRAHNTPPQLVQVGYPGLITAAGVSKAIQLVPKNPDRMSLLVCNPTSNGNITFSYDAPINLGSVGLGNPVQTESSYPESNGSVSINAIYAWSDNDTATFPIPLIAYEGVLSIAGNKR